MCNVSRRKLLLGSAALAAGAVASPSAIVEAKTARPEVGVVDRLTEDVFFHEGNIGVGHCNNGWVIFEDFVLVIDANFPSGAQEIIPKIRALTEKPIRFAFDTHHHGDHAYANQLWVENGATAVAHTGVVDEMKKYETGYYGGAPGRWEEAAKQRPDVKASKLKPPSLLFPKELIFDDGKRRVELIHLGVAHTHGDAVAWLPKEKILFTGDACVNGPFNYVADGNVEKWVATLEAAKKLGAKVICPGHGEKGAQSVLDDQQRYFRMLRDEVGKLVKTRKSPQQVREAAPAVKAALQAEKSVQRYVGDVSPQMEKVYEEMTGKKFPPVAQKTARVAQAPHIHEHWEHGHA